MDALFAADQFPPPSLGFEAAHHSRLSPPINQMPRVKEWEQDLLGNLAGSVEILPDEHWR